MRDTDNARINIDTVFIDTLAAVAVAPDAEAALSPLSGIPDNDDEGEVFVCGAIGRGLASWRFRLVLKTKSLGLDVTLPCWRVLADSEARARDSRNISCVCRLALAILGRDDFPADGERFELVGDESGRCWWRLVALDGGEIRAGEDWGGAIDLVGDANRVGENLEEMVFCP